MNLVTQSHDKATRLQIESEIDRARSAIGEDIRALTEKLNPERLKQEAREVLHDAKEEATNMLRTAKDHAIESVTDTVHELSDRARRAGTSTIDFTSTHAVPLGLLGLGAGWLMLSLRHQRLMSDGSHSQYHRAPMQMGDTVGTDARNMLDSARERVEGLADQAASQLESARDNVKETISDLSQRAADLTHRTTDKMGQFTHDATEQARRASAVARDFARENPLAVGALALAAGFGIAMLLPSTHAENQLMGTQRDRLLGDARDTAKRMRHVTRDATSSLKDAITNPRSGA